MHRVGTGWCNGLCEKKSKIAHYYFMTKAADLKTIFLESP